MEGVAATRTSTRDHPDLIPPLARGVVKAWQRSPAWLDDPLVSPRDAIATETGEPSSQLEKSMAKRVSWGSRTWSGWSGFRRSEWRGSERSRACLPASLFHPKNRVIRSATRFGLRS